MQHLSQFVGIGIDLAIRCNSRKVNGYILLTELQLENAIHMVAGI